MTTKAILEKQVATLEKEIDILRNDVEYFSALPSAVFSVNRLTQEKSLLATELTTLKLELLEIVWLH